MASSTSDQFTVTVYRHQSNHDRPPLAPAWRALRAACFATCGRRPHRSSRRRLPPITLLLVTLLRTHAHYHDPAPSSRYQYSSAWVLHACCRPPQRSARPRHHGMALSWMSKLSACSLRSCPNKSRPVQTWVPNQGPKGIKKYMNMYE